MPVDAVHRELVTEKVLLAPQNNSAAGGIDVDHVTGSACTAGQAFALADRKEFDAVVGTKVIPLHVVKSAGLKGLTAVAQEGLVVLAWDEADLLAVLFVGDLEAKLACNGPDLLLG